MAEPDLIDEGTVPAHLATPWHDNRALEREIELSVELLEALTNELDWRWQFPELFEPDRVAYLEKRIQGLGQYLDAMTTLDLA